MIGSKLFLKASSHPISLSCMYALRTRTRTCKHRPYIPVNVSMFVTSLRTHYCCLIHISVNLFSATYNAKPRTKDNTDVEIFVFCSRYHVTPTHHSGAFWDMATKRAAGAKNRRN